MGCCQCPGPQLTSVRIVRFALPLPPFVVTYFVDEDGAREAGVVVRQSYRDWHDGQPFDAGAPRLTQAVGDAEAEARKREPKEKEPKKKRADA